MGKQIFKVVHMVFERFVFSRNHKYFTLVDFAYSLVTCSNGLLGDFLAAVLPAVSLLFF